MRILFARHGESQANILHEISNRGLKHPLTLMGREQAHTLATRLQDQAITRIYSSPVLRAIETTIILANRLGVEYEVTEALREYDLGELEGRSDERSWALWQELFDDWTKYQHWNRRIPEGEDFHEVRGRFVPFIDGLIQQYQGTGANILCVGHGGLYWVMLPRVLTNINTDFILEHPILEYTSLVVTELSTEGLVCLEWNGIRVGG
jgi:broad specificity phosphatase PhoE